MSKKLIWLKAILLIIMGSCAFGMFDIPSVFAQTVSIPPVMATSDNPAGTITGEGEYQLGDTATLSAALNAGWVFNYWEHTDEGGNATIISTEPEYSYEVTSNGTISANYEQAGIVAGQGYYTLGDTVNLSVKPNAGWKFDMWVCIDDEGNETNLEDLNLPSYESGEKDGEHTAKFVVNKNMTIKCVLSRIEYSVTLAEEDLNDFSLEVTNITSAGAPIYYNNQVNIKVAGKTAETGRYIYNLIKENIFVNGKTVNEILAEDNSPIISCEIQESIGFNYFDLILTVKENIVIDINYDYMYKLSVISGNAILIDDILDFITINGGIKLDNYNYLIREKQEANISFSAGDKVYQFNYAALNGGTASAELSQSYNLTRDSELHVYYSKKPYTVNFATYIQNVYNNYDPIEVDLYSLSSITNVTAGDSVTINYDDSTKQISVNGLQHDKMAVYGYNVVGFSVNNDYTNISKSLTFTMDESNPNNCEIQVLLEYIEYNISIDFVDEYFEPFVQCETTLNTDKLNVGTQVTFSAITTTHTITGWSWEESPSEQDYVSVNDTYSFTFEPISDDVSYKYIIYLDVDYKYFESIFELSSESIVKNVDYDTVEVDETNLTITFIDSYNTLPAQRISYSASDVVVSGSTTSINTNNTTFGVVIIENGQLRYGDGNEYSNPGEIDENGVGVYTFDKYTYMGDLQVAVIKYLTLSENGNNVTFTIIGDIYDEAGNSNEQILDQVITSKSYKSDKLAYQIAYEYSNVYLYMNATEYSHISLLGTNFYYNATNRKFEMRTAQINTPKSITVDITKNSSYQFKVNNLVADSLVIYTSKACSHLYGFDSHWKNGISIYSYLNEDATYNSILAGSQNPLITALYSRNAKDLFLQITNKSAYKDDDISYYIGGLLGTGNTINATIDTSITININPNKITKGYKFVGYRLSGKASYLTTDTTLNFIMNETYAGATIELCFTYIDYILRVNYLNEGNAILDYTKINGTFNFVDPANGNANYVEGTINFAYLNIAESYNFKAISNKGYYLNSAYIGNGSKHEITSLVNTNESANNDTYWTLSSDNFVEAIINHANAANEVQLYIQFTTRNYNIKIYFEISSNPNSIDYPNVIYNGAFYAVNFDEENNKYLAIIENVEYNTLANISIDKDNLMVGVSFLEWRDINGKRLGEALPSNIVIDSNKEYKAILQYSIYDIKFVSVDADGNPCNYGSATMKNSASFILNQTVEYSVYPNAGYVLTGTYYYDNNNQKQYEGVESGFTFTPAKYFIDGKQFIIYLQFGLKQVKVDVDNTMHSDSVNTLGVKPSEWAVFTVSRTRNGEEAEILTSAEDYIFQTGDTLSMTIEPITLGIELNRVDFGDDTTLENIGFKNETGSPYYLRVDTIDDNVNGVRVQYYLQITFTNSLISSFNEEVFVNNVFKVKQYNVLYTYNLKGKSKENGLELIVRNNGAMTSPGKDVDYEQTVNYGSQMTFMVNNSSLSVIGEYYEVLGFKLNGTLDENGGSTTYYLTSMDKWKQVAMERYSQEDSRQITLVLTLSPKITLKNTDIDNPYKYTRTYNSQSQALTVGVDVIVAEVFKLTIEYRDSTNTLVSSPINVDVYDVKILADDGNGEKLPFGRVVTLVIVPAKITLSMTYSSTNPLTKVYDGTTAVYKDALVKGLVLEGVYDVDKSIIIVDKSRLEAYYSDSKASQTERRHITLYNFYIIDDNTKTLPRNYVLAENKTTFTFKEAGQISSRPLVITGFKIGNKVYDGTGEVEADVTGITFNGLVATDSAHVEAQNLRFYCDEYRVGYDREVKLDYSNALSGADSLNYNISYTPIFIDIHPYELVMNITGYGEFKIVDHDKKCLIPIEAKLNINVYDTDSVTYRELYPYAEQQMEAKEKFRVVYEIKLQTGVSTVNVPAGLYLYMPSVSKLSKVVLVNGTDSETVEHASQDDVVVIKVGENLSTICLISETIYLPLWQILLIVLIAGVVLSILILIFISIRRKKKQKYSVNDRI